MTQLVNFSSRKFAVILLTLVITISSAQALSIKVSCEKVESLNWNYVGAQKTCYMDRVTKIDSPNFAIQDSQDDRRIALLHERENLFSSHQSLYELSKCCCLQC